MNKEDNQDWIERAKREAPERLKRIKEFQKQMENQQKIDPEIWWWEFTI